MAESPDEGPLLVAYAATGLRFELAHRSAEGAESDDPLFAAAKQACIAHWHARNAYRT